jgi:hypothetical protein
MSLMRPWIKSMICLAFSIKKLYVLVRILTCRNLHLYCRLFFASGTGRAARHHLACGLQFDATRSRRTRPWIRWSEPMSMDLKPSITCTKGNWRNSRTSQANASCFFPHGWRWTLSSVLHVPSMALPLRTNAQKLVPRSRLGRTSNHPQTLFLPGTFLEEVIYPLRRFISHIALRLSTCRFDRAHPSISSISLLIATFRAINIILPYSISSNSILWQIASWLCSSPSTKFMKIKSETTSRPVNEADTKRCVFPNCFSCLPLLKHLMLASLLTFPLSALRCLHNLVELWLLAFVRMSCRYISANAAR